MQIDITRICWPSSLFVLAQTYKLNLLRLGDMFIQPCFCEIICILYDNICMITVWLLEHIHFLKTQMMTSDFCMVYDCILL